MKITKEIYTDLIGENVRVVCVDGTIVTGIWVDHTSALDNEPDGESITLETAEWPFLEIYVAEIGRIEPAP
jgi:hypothetical protein